MQGSDIKRDNKHCLRHRSYQSDNSSDFLMFKVL